MRLGAAVDYLLYPATQQQQQQNSWEQCVGEDDLIDAWLRRQNRNERFWRLRISDFWERRFNGSSTQCARSLVRLGELGFWKKKKRKAANWNDWIVFLIAALHSRAQCFLFFLSCLVIYWRSFHCVSLFFSLLLLTLFTTTTTKNLRRTFDIVIQASLSFRFVSFLLLLFLVSSIGWLNRVDTSKHVHRRQKTRQKIEQLVRIGHDTTQYRGRSPAVKVSRSLLSLSPSSPSSLELIKRQQKMKKKKQ